MSGSPDWGRASGSCDRGRSPPDVSKLGYEQKYFSLLDFAMQRSDALKSFPDYHGREFYEVAATYARTQGIQVTGVLIHVQVDELLRFLETGPHPGYPTGPRLSRSDPWGNDSFFLAGKGEQPLNK